MGKITISMILSGIKKGVIKIKDEGSVIGRPGSGGCVCAIGDYWFYAFGQEGEVCTPEEYKKNIPLQTIADEIYSVLNGFGGFETELPEEYQYYYEYLKEQGC